MLSTGNHSPSPRVFVVDDDRDSLLYFREVLQTAGMDVETYQRPQEFLDRLRPDQTGCLLLDVRMPDISGLELQRQLAAENYALPMILISGDADVESCSQAFRAGAFDFVEKTISRNDLVDLTQRALRAAIHLRAVAEHRSAIQARSELLTAREKDVKSLMLRGLSIKEIAYQLNIAFQTAAKHRSRVLEKMEVDSDAELIRLESGPHQDPEDSLSQHSFRPG
ncbi:MAG: response regulator [Pirellulales bacterium]|nr:response regulator [Pirellulales bacterium]